MKNRREFLATTIAAAALLTDSSGQAAAALSGLSIVDETGRRDTESNDSIPGGQGMTDMRPDGEIQNPMTQFQEAKA